jgi:uncharacterized protein with HEPN domain
MKGDQLYLRHILDAIITIEGYIAAGRAIFLSTFYWQDAVIRQLEIIGEATKRLSHDLRSPHHEIPWRRMAGLRDVLIYDYMGVDLAAVWEIPQRDLPILRKHIQLILQESGNEP